MKLYVASKFENQEAVREAFEALKAQGHEITHDWTNESAGDLSGEELNDFLYDCAAKDYAGAYYCDALLLINYDKLPMRGALVEMGIAIGRASPVVVITNQAKRDNIFYSLPGVFLVKDLAEAVELLNKLDPDKVTSKTYAEFAGQPVAID